MAYKSKYAPKYHKKYIGDPTKIICRSTWERKVCKFMDLNENVLKWASEEISIPYFSQIDNKWHKYYPDFFCEILKKDKKISKLVIEVKPKKQTKEPVNKKTKSYLREMKTFHINTCKWIAATDFCKKNNWEFKILTEEDIFK